MKKHFLLSLVIIGTSATSNLFARQVADSAVSIMKADSYSVDGSNNRIAFLQGNVSINANKLNIVKADKVTINKNTNTLIESGYNEFTFKGKVIVLAKPGEKVSRLEYVIGSDVLYLK